MIERIKLPINIRPDIRAYMSEVMVFSILDLQETAWDIRFVDPVYIADEMVYDADNIHIKSEKVQVEKVGKEFRLSSKQHIEKKQVDFYWDYIPALEGTLEFTLQFRQRLDVFGQVIVQVKEGCKIVLYSNGQVRVVMGSCQEDYFLATNLVDRVVRFYFAFSATGLKITYTIVDDTSGSIELCEIAADFSVQGLIVYPKCDIVLVK